MWCLGLDLWKEFWLLKQEEKDEIVLVIKNNFNNISLGKNVMVWMFVESIVAEDSVNVYSVEPHKIFFTTSLILLFPLSLSNVYWCCTHQFNSIRFSFQDRALGGEYFEYMFFECLYHIKQFPIIDLFLIYQKSTKLVTICLWRRSNLFVDLIILNWKWDYLKYFYEQGLCKSNCCCNFQILWFCKFIPHCTVTVLKHA